MVELVAERVPTWEGFGCCIAIELGSAGVEDCSETEAEEKGERKVDDRLGIPAKRQESRNAFATVSAFFFVKRYFNNN
jgi:hypothetical protein